MGSDTTIDMSHDNNKYGLEFVQNYIILGGLARIVPLGFFLFLVVLFMPRRETYWVFLLYFTFCISVATILGIWDAQKRFTLLKKNFSEYNRLGRCYRLLYSKGFLAHLTDVDKFYKDVFKVRWRNGEYYILALSVVVVVMAAFVPWFLVISKYSEFLKHDFQYSLYPFLLAYVTFSIYLFARFVYWRIKLVPLIQKEYGYSYQALKPEVSDIA